MKRLCLVFFMVICTITSYAEEWKHTTDYQSKYKNEKCYLVYKSVYNGGRYVSFYNNIYAYNGTNHHTVYTVKYRRCLKHLFSDKKLSPRECSASKTVSRYVAPHAYKQAMFTDQWDDEQNDLPNLVIPGRWPWGFEILHFSVEVLD